MKIQRWLRHLLLPGWWVRRAFPRAALLAIEAAVAESERTHRGEVRFVIEGPLHLSELLKRETPRQRAIELFSQLRVWDTEHNCGVLIYVQLVDRRVEIVVDRGIAKKVPEQQWANICRGMEAAFRLRAYRRGALEAVEKTGHLLAIHFPGRSGSTNELPDQPLVLR